MCEAFCEDLSCQLNIVNTENVFPVTEIPKVHSGGPGS